MTAFVIGNGVSRRGIDIARLRDHGHVYGCNLIFRDHDVDVLVATDRPISDHIQDQGYAHTHRFYTRRPRSNSGAQAVPQPYHGFSSGPIALGLAALDHANPIYLVGFDMGPDAQGRFNNIYAGEEFYKAPGSTPTYTGNWCRQLVQICGDFPDTIFYRVYGDTTQRIDALDRVRNLRHITLDRLFQAINTAEESRCRLTNA